jgi:hypothetical protein
MKENAPRSPVPVRRHSRILPLALVLLLVPAHMYAQEFLFKFGAPTTMKMLALSLLLPVEAIAAAPQSPVSVTCINLEATAGEGPRHRYEICTPQGCFLTRTVPGGCPAP